MGQALLLVWLWVLAWPCLAPPADNVKLKVGDAAPPFVAGRWLQGGPLDKPLTNGTVVVLFWTSLEPAGLAGMSRMDGMREKFGPMGVTFLGVRVWEHPQEEWEPVRKRMGLAVEMPLMADAHDPQRKGMLATTWLEPAQIEAVPVVFVLHQGRIAWIGHPLGLREQTLIELGEGTYQWEEAISRYSVRFNNAEAMASHWARLQEAMEDNNWKLGLEILRRMSGLMPPDDRVGLGALQFRLLEAEGRFKEAMELAAELAERHPEESHLLNMLAWELATNDDFEKPDYTLILKIAEQANAAAYGRDAHILDTYARALFLKGRKQDAIDAQKRAVQLAPADVKGRFEKVLRYYQRGELPPVED